MEQIQAFWNPDWEVIQEDEESKEGTIVSMQSRPTFGLEGNEIERPGATCRDTAGNLMFSVEFLLYSWNGDTEMDKIWSLSLSSMDS